MSRRACGKVNAGVFFKFDLQPHQEQLRQEHQADVPMPRRPGAVFVVIQSELRFVSGIIAFYQRQGFKLVGEQPVAGGGLTVWGMVREPA